ncbi:unnamed protein product, partial [Choristocarpus tenellus]
MVLMQQETSLIETENLGPIIRIYLFFFGMFGGEDK